jgi:PPIC-type PPIASE domain
VREGAIVKLQFCHEEIMFEDAVTRLMACGMGSTLVSELGKAILYQNSIDDYQIGEPNTSRMEQILGEFCTQNKVANHNGLQEWLDARHMSLGALKKQLVFQDQLTTLKRLVVPDAVVKEIFLKRKHTYDLVLFGLIQVSDEHLSWELYYRLKDDHQDFARLAKTYSITPEAAVGGIMGPYRLEQISSEIRTELLKLNHGEVSEPFTPDDKIFAIVRLLRLDYAPLSPQLENSLREELFQEWGRRQLDLNSVRLEMGSPFA